MELIDWESPYCTRSAASPQGYLVRDWRDAERVAALWTRRFGYADAGLTLPGSDDGIDVYATGAVAQVKWWERSNAGIEDAQRIVGAAKPGQVALFFTRKGYTRAASTWADDPDARLALFLLHTDGHVTAVNRYAMEVLHRSPNRTPAYAAKPEPIRTRLKWGILAGLSVAASLPAIWWLLLSDWSLHPVQRLTFLLFVLFCATMHAVTVRDNLGTSAQRLIRAIRDRRWPGIRPILTDTVPTRPDWEPPWEDFNGLWTPSSLHWGIRLEHLQRPLREIARQTKGRWLRARSSQGARS
ncbi:restriction endonuclease [Flindersiella endophytica]